MGEQVAARLFENSRQDITDRNELSVDIWGCSSVGRAPALQAGGQEFESLHLHSVRKDWEKESQDSVVRNTICTDRDFMFLCTLKTVYCKYSIHAG